jgi:hypothetical protein
MVSAGAVLARAAAVGVWWRVLLQLLVAAGVCFVGDLTGRGSPPPPPPHSYSHLPPPATPPPHTHTQHAPTGARGHREQRGGLHRQRRHLVTRHHGHRGACGGAAGCALRCAAHCAARGGWPRPVGAALRRHHRTSVKARPTTDTPPVATHTHTHTHTPHTHTHPARPTDGVRLAAARRAAPHARAVHNPKGAATHTHAADAPR